MIKINTNHIADLPMAVTGTESADVLELSGPDAPRPGSGINYHLLASMAGRDLLVQGEVSLTIETVCGRCLAPVKTVLKADKVCHLYEGVAGQEVDVTEEIREDVLLAIPYLILCRPDCKGLCPGCGADLNTEECTCSAGKKKKKHDLALPEESPAETSPWDALSALTFSSSAARKTTRRAAK